MGLLRHNENTLKEVNSFADRGANCCVVNPCGSGKTSVMAAFIRAHLSSTFLVITKQKNAARYFMEKDPVFSLENVAITTFTKMCMDFKAGRNAEWYKADYYLIDEAHYLGAEKWGAAFKHLFGMYHPVLIGFTATPQRFEDQGTVNTIVDQFFDGNSAGNYTSSQLEKAGVFTEPEYILSIHNIDEIVAGRLIEVDEADVPDREKKVLREKLDRIADGWRKEASPEVVMKQNLPGYMYKDRCNRILVYCASFGAIQENREFIGGILSRIFPDKKITDYVYTYKDPESRLSEFLAEDDSYIKVLYSIDKVMETIHIDDLKVMIMLRPSVSNRIITQQFGRVNNIRNSDRALIIDMVNNLQNLDCVRRIHERDAGCGASRTARAGRVPGAGIRYLSHCSQIFSETDKVLSRSAVYTYKGFTGTLKGVCYVHDLNCSFVESLIKDGVSFHDAAAEAEKKRKKVYNCSTSAIPDFELSKEEMDFAEENMYMVSDFARRRGLKDEDAVQSLHVYYLYAVHRSFQDHNPSDPAYTRRQYIATFLRGRYLSLKRAETRRRRLLDPDAQVGVFQEDFVGVEAADSIKKVIIEQLNHLDERERYCVSQYYFGERSYSEIGEDLGLTKQRIRQIVCQAMRSMRMSSKASSIWEAYLSSIDALADDVDAATFCRITAY